MSIEEYKPLTRSQELENQIWKILDLMKYEGINVEPGCFSEGEEKYTFYTSFYVRPDEYADPVIEQEKLEKVFRQEMPAEWCKHDYDCCGSYYQGRVRIMNDYAHNSGCFTLKIRWTQNV